jgi:hypothetical protein
MMKIYFNTCKNEACSLWNRSNQNARSTPNMMRTPTAPNRLAAFSCAFVGFSMVAAA